MRSMYGIDFDIVKRIFNVAGRHSSSLSPEQSIQTLRAYADSIHGYTDNGAVSLSTAVLICNAAKHEGFVDDILPLARRVLSHERYSEGEKNHYMAFDRSVTTSLHAIAKHAVLRPDTYEAIVGFFETMQGDLAEGSCMYGLCQSYLDVLAKGKNAFPDFPYGVFVNRAPALDSYQKKSKFAPPPLNVSMVAQKPYDPKEDGKEGWTNNRRADRWRTVLPDLSQGDQTQHPSDDQSTEQANTLQP